MASPPHQHLRNQLCHALYSASLALTRAYRPLLAPLDLTYPQYLVMLALWEDDEPLSVGQLCERTHLETGTVTPLLQRLEQKGLLHRSRSSTDERRREIRLTTAGHALQRQAQEIPLKMACLEVLQPAEAIQLKRLSEAVHAGLERVGASTPASRSKTGGSNRTARSRDA